MIFYILTREKATQHPEELRDLYSDLTSLSNSLKNLSTSTILTVGEFNGKVGKADDFETRIGKLSLGQRNDNRKKFTSGVKTIINFCATTPSSTNKVTELHDQTQLSTETPTKYITHTTKLITLSWVKAI